ncbi:MAG: hypothetical protein U0805_04550 [Pirellulales bacterium]
MRDVYRTRPELAVEMLQVLAKAKKTLRFHVVADSLYGGKSVLRELPANCQLTSRLHLDARLYDARYKRGGPANAVGRESEESGCRLPVGCSKIAPIA